MKKYYIYFFSIIATAIALLLVFILSDTSPKKVHPVEYHIDSKDVPATYIEQRPSINQPGGKEQWKRDIDRQIERQMYYEKAWNEATKEQRIEQNKRMKEMAKEAKKEFEKMIIEDLPPRRKDSLELWRTFLPDSIK